MGKFVFTGFIFHRQHLLNMVFTLILLIILLTLLFRFYIMCHNENTCD